MNVLEEMKRMVDEFVIESEEFIRRMKENDRKNGTGAPRDDADD